MNDRIFHPNKYDVFSAMQYNMGSCVKKMHDYFKQMPIESVFAVYI